MPEAVRPESPEVSTRRIALAAVGLFALLIAVVLGFTLIFPDRIGKAFTVERPFPAPGVTPDERAQRAKLEKSQRDLLQGSDGRLPIEAAMKAIAAKGARAFDPVEGTP